MREDLDRILDMIEMCDLLLQHASRRDVLDSDPVVQAAAQRWIEVLGEAALHVSDEVKELGAPIRWREIVGTRLILAHAYFRIDRNVIGGIVEEEIPRLRQQLEDLLQLLHDAAQ